MDENEEPAVEWFRGDYRDYPEDLWPYAKEIRDDWKFVLPPRPRKGNKRDKSTYSFWILSLGELRTACGELGVKVLEEYRKDFIAYMVKHNGLGPFTISGPQSLVGAVRGKAALMRIMQTDKKKEHMDDMITALRSRAAADD